MKTSDVLVLGGLAYLLFRGRGSLELPRQLPDPRSAEEVEKRWTIPYTPEPIEKSVYRYAYAAAMVPIASLASRAEFVKSIWDIPTTENFGVYGVDKGTYKEFYYTV